MDDKGEGECLYLQSNRANQTTSLGLNYHTMPINVAYLHYSIPCN